MGTLSAESAGNKRSKYNSYIDDVISDMNKNFDDMDFENADQRTNMQDEFNAMIQKCENAKINLDNLRFS